MRIVLPALFRSSVLLLALLSSIAASAQESFSSLEERMTGKEFHETGLYKLSASELAALNAWIRARSLTEQEVVELDEQRAAGSMQGASARGDRRGLSGKSDNAPIESRLVGTFSGWSGGTVFTLENGMVWKQREAGNYRTAAAENPKVTIKPGVFGVWYLQVEGHNRRVKVERIE